MEITCLLENNTTDPQLAPAHGLSFFIRTGTRSILFDMGPDQKFADNAKHLGVDLSKVDMAVLSHGHYDHGGGIPQFQKINDKAAIIMTRGPLKAGTMPATRIMIPDISALTPMPSTKAVAGLLVRTWPWPRI